MAQTTVFHIPALDCPDELALVERSLRKVPGIEQLGPDYLARNLRVEYDPAHTSGAALQQAIQAAGFPAQIVEPIADRAPAIDSGSAPKRLSSVTMLVGGTLLAIAVGLHFIGADSDRTAAIVAVASTIVSGIPVAMTAWRAVRLRALDMNVLMTIAAAGAIAIGDHFEAATAMLLFAVSLWLERISLFRAQRAIRSLVEVAPSVAHRLSGNDSTGEIVDVRPEELSVGDRVLVRPGERIPADGDVLIGNSSVNQAPITGESTPVEKLPGERVFAGTLNGEGSLEIRVARAADDTTLARIARLIDDARASRSPTERFVDAFARRYTPVVIALAIAIMIVPTLLASIGVSWASSVEPVQWIHRGLVLLVIACPCALVISTPVTIVSGLHQATRLGILVKGGEFLERAASLRAVAIDKTGTVTTGIMQVVGVEAFNGNSADEVLAISAALERASEHPLAKAITAAASQRKTASRAAGAITALRGFGVQGDSSGDTYFLGNARLFGESQFRLTGDDRQRLSANGSAKQTVAWLGTSDRLLGLIKLVDLPRIGAAEAIAELRKVGIKQIIMLTGDRSAVAQYIARKVGIETVHSDLLPQDKIELVQSLKAGGTLAMVGDGVNDAPALAAADVGIALGGQSSDVAIETADVVIMQPELGKVPQLIRLSQRCRRLLKQNIAFSLATKLAVIVLAAFGLATMWLAVAADVGTSLAVIANGLRMIERR